LNQAETGQCIAGTAGEKKEIPAAATEEVSPQEKWFREIGLAPVAEQKLPNFLLNRPKANQFIAATAGESKEDK